MAAGKNDSASNESDKKNKEWQDQKSLYTQIYKKKIINYKKLKGDDLKLSDK